MSTEQTPTSSVYSLVDDLYTPPHENKSWFLLSELLLPHDEWSEIVRQKREHLSRHARSWLEAWERWDLACSPMDDNRRRQIRYGHHLGWLACINVDRPSR